MYHVVILTKGYVAIIDREDRRRVSKHSWQVTYGGGKRLAQHKPYAKTRIKGKTVYLHRFVMNAQPGSHVDHLNHETLDCRKENLEEITPLENNARRRVRKAKSKDEKFLEGTQWTCEQLGILEKRRGGKSSVQKTEEGSPEGNVAEVRELDGDRSLRHERVSRWAGDLGGVEGSFTAKEPHGRLDCEAESSTEPDCLASSEG